MPHLIGFGEADIASGSLVLRGMEGIGEPVRGRRRSVPKAVHVGSATKVNGDGSWTDTLDCVFGPGWVLLVWHNLCLGCGEGCRDIGDEVFGLHQRPGEFGFGKRIIVSRPQGELCYLTPRVFLEARP